MKKLLLLIFTCLTLCFAFAGTLQPAYAAAADDACDGAKGKSGASCEGLGFTAGLKTVANVIIFIVGAAAVLMVIIGGFRYVLSGGDSAGVESAKNTIMYAVIGIVVALLSYAIVNFVIASFDSGNNPGSGPGSGPGSLNPPTSPGSPP